MGYLAAVGAELRKNRWNAVVVVVFTIARLLFGWDWLKAGLEKLSWLGDGKFNSGKLIQGMVANFQHSHGPDPLHLNNVLVFFANHVFLNLGALVDFFVVVFEILIGVFAILGFGFIWTIVVALFLNLQYAAAGAANNFGYLVTDIVWIRFPNYASLIGVDGYIRYLRGQNLLGAAGPATKKLWHGGHSDHDAGVGMSSRRGTPAV